MPFTLLAHQAPVLPLAAWARGRLDGVALAAGSVAPDLLEVTRGWGDGPRGRILLDGHAARLVPLVVVVAVVCAVLTRRLVLPALPAALPDLGAFHLRDLRHLGVVEHRWFVVMASAALGVATHLALDGLTHGSSPVVTLGLVDGGEIEVGGRHLAVTTLLQILSSVPLGVATVWMLRRMGAARRFVPRSGGRPELRLPPRALGAFWAWIGLSLVVAAAYAMTRTGYHVSARGVLPLVAKPTVVSSFCCVAFVGLLVGCAGARPFLVVDDEPVEVR